MTISVIWQDGGYQWCAADTRLVAGSDEKPTTELAAKIYTIPVAVTAMTEGFARTSHYWTQYGFTYAGAVLPATMTAVTASTFLQKLVCPGGLSNPPSFEEIASFICRLAERFMKERRQLSGEYPSDEGLFSAALFGWCPFEEKYKLAHIDARSEASFRVELNFPQPPQTDGDPWLILGSAEKTFRKELAAYRSTETHITRNTPRRVIEKMVIERPDRTVGGATSIGAAHKRGFDIFYALEPIEHGQTQVRRLFNGLDLDTDVGQIGQYFVGINGMA
ncbi:hypothetical protein KUD11_02355 [Roseovarius sp. LXJ103]|uniref:hypothetical protein n=1 Tax=Roseovarius carneus TaxID=2853164 RepID=UPI000D620AB1|nr:hypothetical protein [Roseovarius carneus]MBZ8117482.1 hypothetical protein [Roseovarius carneus]PWE37370.1 hypothetical protein DD563_12590 [Pelagicola sp. LXJ1103]